MGACKGSIMSFVPCEESRRTPWGACKGSVMPVVDIILIMKIYDCMSCFSSVSPFQPRDSLVLYTDRSLSPGRLQPSLVCQVACRGQGQEVSGPRSSKSS